MKVAPGIKIDKSLPDGEQTKPIVVIDDHEILSLEEFIAWISQMVDDTNALMVEMRNVGCYFKHPSIQRAVSKLEETSHLHGS